MSPTLYRGAAPAPLWLAILLAMLTMLSPFSIDTFFPSLRDIERQFAVSPLATQQLLTAYMLPYALMALVHGPLTDALGRRRIALLGLGAHAAASFACALAPSFAVLLAMRAAQGITAGAGMAVSRAVVRDLYDGPEAQRLLSTMSMIFTLAPAVAPVVGGVLQVNFGWRASFVFVALLAAMLWVAVWRRLPETHPPERRLPFAFVPLARASWNVMRHREFQLLALANALL
ncbi:MAG: MFS transporter, partial [Steroidobacteraceae bacterium]|nr:MFS transporter [Steroidobacteraceae bacterium]